ncbi:hypothetical protein TNCV_3142341 [Trichonephila clavipes]|nr:hypothetical protein TNCV_3142341 [Trichonephila clavipes]
MGGVAESGFRITEPLKTYHVDGLMRVKSVEVQSSHVGGGGEVSKVGYHLRCCPRHLTYAQNNDVHRQ